MASRVTFVLPLLTFSIVAGGGLFSFETQYECPELKPVDTMVDGFFYLKLFNADNSSSFNKSSSTCSADDKRISDLSCMCGDNLREKRNRSMELLLSTCLHYKEDISNISSPLGFCERSLKQLGRCVAFEKDSDNVTDVFNSSSLNVKLKEIEKIFTDYFNVLHRTIVRVYLPSEAHRCQCLVSFSHDIVYLAQWVAEKSSLHGFTSLK